tara:strand:+ start:15813 stop:16127 length:315 start_codon:yes stop_codon:yes gene_type:complete
MDMNKKQRGRPPVDISWPDVVFTAQDVVDSCTKKVSRVTIHSKLNSAVDSGELKVVGQVKSPNGRPRVKYLKVSLDERGDQQVESCPAPQCPSGLTEEQQEKEW